MTLIDAPIDDRVQLGLTALALCRGNSTDAEQMLANEGHDVPAATLRRWRTRDHVALYEEIRANRATQVERTVINDARDLAIAYAELERVAIVETTAKLASGDVKDPSTVLRNAAVAKGVNIDKFLILDGRPTSISEHRTRDDIFKELEREGMIDSTAEEIPPEAFRTEAHETKARELEA